MKLAARRTTTAVATVATAGVSSLFLGATPAMAAPGDACDGGTLVGPGICEITYTSGTATFTPTATMTQLEVLLVGAGGSGADQPTPNTNGYAAAGGGGEVTIVDFSGATDPIEITVPVAGTTGGATDGTITETVGNGADATDDTGTGGSSGSGNPGATGGTGGDFLYGSGGGAADSPDNNADGGAGAVVDDLAAPGSLFEGDTRCFGGGGAVGVVGVQGIPGCGAGGPTDNTATALTAPAANSGGGGGGVSTSQSPEARAGAAGVVIVRYNGATAALTFEMNGHGTAPATQFVVAGTAPVKPADPTASGYQFDGWFSDEALTVPADFSAALTGAATFYAKWSPALAATGSAPELAVLPIGLATLLAGAGLIAITARKRRES